MQRHQSVEGALDAGAKIVLRGGRVTVAEHFEASPIVILEHRQREPRKRVLAEIPRNIPDADAIPPRTQPCRLPTWDRGRPARLFIVSSRRQRGTVTKRAGRPRAQVGRRHGWARGGTSSAL